MPNADVKKREEKIELFCYCCCCQLYQTAEWKSWSGISTGVSFVMESWPNKGVREREGEKKTSNWEADMLKELSHNFLSQGFLVIWFDFLCEPLPSNILNKILKPRRVLTFRTFRKPRYFELISLTYFPSIFQTFSLWNSYFHYAPSTSQSTQII